MFPEGGPLPSVAELRKLDDPVIWGLPVTREHLALAYRRGIFPWPTGMRGMPIPWCSPDPRALLHFSDLHLPRSLARAARSTTLTFSIDRAFEDVMKACAAAKRPGQRGTWITAAMLRGYTDLHHHGMAHSIEAWRGEELVGGLYGVDAGGVFTGESMFYREDNASKLALLHLIDHCRARGATWIDIQQLTPHLEALGAVEVSRDKYLDLLLAAQASGVELFPKRATE